MTDLEKTGGTVTQMNERPQRVTIKLVDGTRIVRDFPTRLKANEAVDDLYFFARHKESHVMRVVSDDGLFEFSPYAVAYISNEPAATSDTCRDWTLIESDGAGNRTDAPRHRRTEGTAVMRDLSRIGPAYIRAHRRRNAERLRKHVTAGG